MEKKKKQQLLQIMRERIEHYAFLEGTTIGETRIMFQYKKETFKEIYDLIEKNIKQEENEDGLLRES